MQRDDKARGGRRRANPPPPDPDQQFLIRARQLRVLSDCVLPNVPGVKGSTMKSVLRALIDRLGGKKECWPSQDRIAKDVGLTNRRQVCRALKALEDDLGVIYSRKGRTPGSDRGVSNFYRIVWNQLALLCPNEPINAKVDCAKGGTIDAESDCAKTGALNVPFQPSIVPPVAQEPPIGNSPKNLPPPPKVPRTWEAVEEDFKDRLGNVAELAAELRGCGWTAGEFEQRANDAWATATLPENASTIKSPGGAVDWFLRNGNWPCSGVVSLQDVGEVRARRREVQAARVVSEMQDELATIIRERRRSGMTDAELAALIRSRFPAEFCDAQGWPAIEPVAGNATINATKGKVTNGSQNARRVQARQRVLDSIPRPHGQTQVGIDQADLPKGCSGNSQ